MIRISRVYFLSLFLLTGTIGMTAYGEESAPPPSSDSSSVAESPAAAPAAEAPSSSDTGASKENVPVKEETVQHKEPVKETPEASKAAIPSAPPKAVPSREEALREWKFLKSIGKDSREEMMESVLFQLNAFLKLNADWDFSDEAQQLKADLHVRRKEYKDAAVDILKLIYEYPNSRLVFPAKRTLADLIDKKLDKKIKSALNETAKGSDAKDKQERLAQFLRKLSEQAGDALYEQLVAEFNDFFCKFPAYAGTDELNVLLGDLHAKKGKYLAAMTYYQKVLAIYPESRVRPLAQRSIGDLYMTYIKDMNEAVNAYQEVINQYPGSDDTAYAYEQIAKLEEQQKHFELSVEISEKVIQLYPNKPTALRAFNNEARILNDQMKKPNDAIQVYGRLADMFKGSADAAAALKTAAALARKQKNFDLEVSQYLRIVNECEAEKDAPEILFQAAQITEEDLKEYHRAIDLYKELTEKYPDNKLAKKARGRMESLAKKK